MKLSKTAMVNEMLAAGFDCYNHSDWRYKGYQKGRYTLDALNRYTANYLVYHTAGTKVVENLYKAFKGEE